MDRSRGEILKQKSREVAISMEDPNKFAMEGPPTPLLYLLPLPAHRNTDQRERGWEGDDLDGSRTDTGWTARSSSRDRQQSVMLYCRGKVPRHGVAEFFWHTGPQLELRVPAMSPQKMTLSLSSNSSLVCKKLTNCTVFIYDISLNSHGSNPCCLFFKPENWARLLGEGNIFSYSKTYER